jgi:hypothetical protein
MIVVYHWWSLAQEAYRFVNEMINYSSSMPSMYYENLCSRCALQILLTERVVNVSFGLFGRVEYAAIVSRQR